MSATKQLLKEIPPTEFHPDWTKPTNYKEEKKKLRKKGKYGFYFDGF